MQDFFEHIFASLKRESLTSEEDAAIRNSVRAFIAEHPVRMPLHLRIREQISYGAASFGLRSFHFNPIAAALVLALFVGAGTSYAAEGALPGDALYTVKVNVNESVRGALAVSGKARAEWNTDRATRRLEETETLAAEGRLTPEAQATVQAGLQTATDDFDDSVSSLVENDDAPAVLAVQSDLEASLHAHEQVLATLSAVLPEDHSDVRPILALVRARTGRVESARGKSERASASVRVTATVMKESSQGESDQMRASGEGAASTSPTAAISTGDEKMDPNRYGEAYGAFQASVRTMSDGKQNVEALKDIQQKIREHLKDVSDSRRSSGNEGGTNPSKNNADTSSVEIELH